jgi:2',5'-phosphodiesterase
MNKISVLTYNILSSTLATLLRTQIKDNIAIYDKPFMDDINRWNKISFYINKVIDNGQNLIICLQEVSEDWLPKLAYLFASKSYSYINNQYGRIQNGNMGVLIAYPSKYQIVKSEFFHIGQHIMITDDNSKIAASKSNIAILLILEDPTINLKFGIATYHMPCVPTIPKISLIHCKVLYKKIYRFMSNIEWILAGDFNMLPDSIAYQYMITKSNCIWQHCMNNIYPITNHAYIGSEFSGCIDYIFYSKNQIKCKKIKISKHNNKIMPNKDEPSDHLPIICKFLLETK